MVSGREWQRKTDGKSSHAAGPKAVGSSPLATSRDNNPPRRKHTLPKGAILRGYRAFSDVLATGTYVQQSGIRCYILATSTIPPATYQVGFAVQGERKAVDRNRLKRWAREAFRLNKQPLTDCCARLPVGTACVFLISRKRMRAPASFNHFNAIMPKLIDHLCAHLSDSYGKR